MSVSPDRVALARVKTLQLLLLMHLDEKRSVLRAASALHMTQPTASRLLQSLEEAMGVQLFVRHARGVEPTPYGEIAVRHARIALMELQHTFDEVSALKAGLSGQVAIGTEWTAAITFVPRAVAILKQRFPQVLVTIEMDFSEALVRRLQENTLDIIIARIHNSRDVTGLRYEALKEVKHTIVARVGHPLARKRGLGLRDLASQTWILPPQGNVMRDRLTMRFLEEGLTIPKQVVETSSLSITTSMLHISDMIALLATDAVRPYSASGILKALPVDVDLRISPAGIITRRDQQLSPGADALLKVLREVAGIRTNGR